MQTVSHEAFNANVKTCCIGNQAGTLFQSGVMVHQEANFDEHLDSRFWKHITVHDRD